MANAFCAQMKASGPQRGGRGRTVTRSGEGAEERDVGSGLGLGTNLMEPGAGQRWSWTRGRWPHALTNTG